MNRFPYIAKAFPFATQRGQAVADFFTRADLNTVVPVRAFRAFRSDFNLLVLSQLTSTNTNTTQKHMMKYFFSFLNN